MPNRSQRGRRELNGVDSSGWDGQPIDYGGVSPPTGCDPYNGVMTVGNNGSGTFGFNTNTPPNSHGAMVPSTINGQGIFQFTFQPGTNSCVLVMVGSVKIPSEPEVNSSILVTIGTNPEVEFPWGGSDYNVADATLANYIQSQDGNQLPVCINWGTGDPPE